MTDDLIRLTALPNVTKPALEDLLYIVTDPDGSPSSGNIKVSDMLKASSIFNVSMYGAMGDSGATDDTAAINDTIAAANTAGKGATVYFPPGEYGISGALTALETMVSMVTDGFVRIFAIGGSSAFGPMVSVGAIIAGGAPFTSPNGTRSGTLRGFDIDGNSIATKGLFIGDSNQRSFIDIDVHNCTNQGVILDGSQNCRFLNVNSYNNGSDTPGTYDCNLLIDRGASGNNFFGGEFHAAGSGAQGKYNVIFRKSGTPSSSTGNYPQCNAFYDCIFEFSTSNYVAQIYLKTGVNNSFNNCVFEISGTRKIFLADVTDGGAGYSSFTRFNNCVLQGTTASGTPTAFDLTGHEHLYIENCYFNNFSTLVTGDAASSVRINGHLFATGVTTMFGANMSGDWIAGGPPGLTNNGEDDNPVLVAGQSTRIQWFNETLLADRTITLPATGILDGLQYRIVRPATGAYTLTCTNGTPALALAAGEWAEYTGYAGYWILTGFGTL